MPRRATDDVLIDLPPGRTPRRPELEEELRTGIRSGRLRAGSQLPSSRSLAEQLGVSRGVVVAAYSQLTAEGYVIARHGSGTQVAAVNPAGTRDPQPSPQANYQFDFHPGVPDLERFPRASWKHATRRAIDRVPTARLGYADPLGAPELRHALAGHLARSRRVAGNGTSIVVTAGFVQAFGLVCGVLKASGATTIAIEEPGWSVARAIALHHGLTPIPVPVDGEGLRTDLLRQTHAQAVFVTPAHQYPTGAVLSAERRADLIRWADAQATVVVEDDYDAEYRYDRRPVGCLQGLAPEHVIYIGSASKILAPGLRLGWLVVPDRLLAPHTIDKALADAGCSTLDQLALADLIESGELSRHLHRMRRHYRRRRAALVDAIAELLPETRVQGIAAGLHALVLMPAEVQEQSLVASAAAKDIRLEGFSQHHMSGQPAGPGLVLGYGGVDESRIRDGIRAVADLVRRAIEEPQSCLTRHGPHTGDARR